MIDIHGTRVYNVVIRLGPRKRHSVTNAFIDFSHMNLNSLRVRCEIYTPTWSQKCVDANRSTLPEGHFAVEIELLLGLHTVYCTICKFQRLETLLIQVFLFCSGSFRSISIYIRLLQLQFFCCRYKGAGRRSVHFLSLCQQLIINQSCRLFVYTCSNVVFAKWEKVCI